MDPLHRYLEALYAATDGPARVASDPVRFTHRYTDPRDVELAGLFAVSLAYGRVDLFLPVLDRLFATFDARGGPRTFVEAFEPDHAAPFLDVVYRWNRGQDFSLLAGALRRVLARHGSVQALFASPGPMKARLERAVSTLRQAVMTEARRQGLAVARFDDLPRGTRYLLPSPAGGSACKRWNLYLRWMVRTDVEGIDRGVWARLSPADLVMPVDVHVSRISRFVGLTDRPDASWRTAEQITARLRAFDPADPVRFDFALAHLGISGACLGHRDATICARCPLNRHCTAPAAPPSGRAAARERVRLGLDDADVAEGALEEAPGEVP